MKEFIEKILQEDYKDNYKKIYEDSDLIKYLDRKTSAINGNSKARKNLGNIYTIYALLSNYVEEFYNDAEKYKKFDGFEYTKLLNFCRKQYGGEKLQNHAINSRLNDEFDNKSASGKNKGKYIVIQNNSKYLMNIDYIYTDGIDTSKSVIKIIEEYIRLIKQKDADLIKSLEELSKEQDIKKVKEKICDLLTENSEARVFEIISYAILKNYYKTIKVYFGYSLDKINEEFLNLYKTGRTNANDGGIDFVMRPVGRFFQVTEVGNYDKYFLDIDKVIHFPITFVIKTNKSKEKINEEIKNYILEKSGGMEVIIDRYTKAIEEIITINELKEKYENLSDENIKDILNDIVTYYRLEMNFTDITG